MLIPDLKHQGKVWAEVTHPEALAVVQELLQYARPGERLFRHWKDAAAMREAFRCKARLAGLTYQENGRFIPLRPHDACKVTEVTSLDERGATLGQISAVSNTTADTLSKHYLKPDRKRAFQRVREIYARTTHRPQAGDFKPVSAGPIDQNSFKARDKNRQVSDEECAA